MVTRKNGVKVRAVQHALERYVIPSLGRAVRAHDLRRTYAHITQRHGMDWDALRSNLGHSSLRVTEKYVGLAVSWDARIVDWTLP